jgi:hypothetical protein
MESNKIVDRIIKLIYITGLLDAWSLNWSWLACLNFGFSISSINILWFAYIENINIVSSKSSKQQKDFTLSADNWASDRARSDFKFC